MRFPLRVTVWGICGGWCVTTQAGTLPCPQSAPIFAWANPGDDMRSLIVATGLSLAMLSSAWAETAKAPVVLAPHRAVYDLSLARSDGSSKGVESARGRIAMEFAGDACDGYTQKYRQVTVLDTSEGGPRTLD